MEHFRRAKYVSSKSRANIKQLVPKEPLVWERLVVQGFRSSCRPKIDKLLDFPWPTFKYHSLTYCFGIIASKFWSWLISRKFSSLECKTVESHWKQRLRNNFQSSAKKKTLFWQHHKREWEGEATIEWAHLCVCACDRERVRKREIYHKRSEKLASCVVRASTLVAASHTLLLTSTNTLARIHLHTHPCVHSLKHTHPQTLTGAHIYSP